MLSHIIAEKLRTVFKILPGKDTRMIVPVPLGTSLCTFTFADLNLHPFAILNSKYKYNSFLTPVSQSSESFNLKVVLWILNTVM